MKPKPPLEVAEIFRRFADAYLHENPRPVSAEQKRVLSAILCCRTAALGGHVKACDNCEYREISYNSCRNRHCPKCQAMQRAQWFEAREKELLPVHYFHLVFTLPEELRLLAVKNKKAVYAILFRASAETLREVARGKLKAAIGFFGILHTWGQNLLHHPHIHFVVPGGGLSPDRSSWISTSKRYFLPHKVLQIVFRGKFLSQLEQAFKAGELSFTGPLAKLATAAEFKKLLTRAANFRWVVHVKPPFAGPKAVLKYLARYTHRVAIANSRLISLVGRELRFRWKDYRDGGRQKIMTLDVLEFIRRFLLHLLPKGFMRIRYYGFLATRKRKESIELCRELLSQGDPSEDVPPQHEAESADDKEQRLEKCPACKTGRLILVETFERPGRFAPAIPVPALDTS